MCGRLRQPDWVPTPAPPPGDDGLDGEDGRYMGSGGADMRGKRARARAGSGGMSRAVSMQVSACMWATLTLSLCNSDVTCCILQLHELVILNSKSQNADDAHVWLHLWPSKWIGM